MKESNVYIKKQEENIATLCIFSTENMKERTKGLLHLPVLQKNQGLLLNHCRSIHTIGMSYTIDVIYLAKNNEIIKIVDRLKPYRMSACILANRTLELLAGEAERLSLCIGMRVELSCDH
jgi:uncharacterized membrane protein (UPF0127 family)